jgi:molybdate transport system regulatory protein
LSAQGERVLRLYQKLQALQAQVLEAAEEASDLDLLSRLMLRTSARNQLQGRVEHIESRGRTDIVRLALGGELHLDAQITHDSTLSLALNIGSPVVALIKAGWLQILAADQATPADHNSLSGIVQQIIDDPAGPSEVRISLSNGQTLCALSEAEHLAGIDAREGANLKVVFSPSYVLLGTQL